MEGVQVSIQTHKNTKKQRKGANGNPQILSSNQIETQDFRFDLIVTIIAYPIPLTFIFLWKIEIKSNFYFSLL